MATTEAISDNDRDTIAAAFTEWAVAIGHQYVDTAQVICDLYGRSTSPWKQAPIGVVKPCTTAEVQAVVRIAAKYGVPLYPVSGGKNWGLGDACPTGPGQVVLDLRRLNRIREVNEELGYAVVEAGVTQGQLYEYLCEYAPNLMMDATGAGPDATIVGNIMERGFGHSPYGDRYQNSCNYEIVLASGDVIRTGFGQFKNAKIANLLKVGLGPSLDGLFTQSNLGIVTSMTIWLMPRPERVEAFAFKVDHDKFLGPIIDALRPLRLQGVLTSTIHIANDLRLISSKKTYPYREMNNETPLSPELRHRMRKEFSVGAWNVLGGIYGNRSLVRATRSIVTKALHGIAKPRFINDRRIAIARGSLGWINRLGMGKSLTQQLHSVESAFDLLKGKPIAEHLRGTAWRQRNAIPAASPPDPLDRGDGLVWLSPTLPMCGTDAEKIHQVATKTLKYFGFDPLMTFVSMNSRAMCSPTTICYDKQDVKQFEQARACYIALLEAMVELGYPPYRLAPQSMRNIATKTQSESQNVVSKLRSAIDPENLVAPHRYS